MAAFLIALGVLLMLVAALMVSREAALFLGGLLLLSAGLDLSRR